VSMSHYDLRQAIIRWFDRQDSLILEDFTDHYYQPREPVKRALEELCNFDKANKVYTLKRR